MINKLVGILNKRRLEGFKQGDDNTLISLNTLLKLKKYCEFQILKGNPYNDKLEYINSIILNIKYKCQKC